MEKNVFKVINSEKNKKKIRRISNECICSADLEDSIGKEQKPH
jgi:predicted DNA-binding ArsR family transcriptional regulator